LQSKHKETVGDHIRSFQSGEEKGFSFFFKEYYAALTYFSFQIINDRSEAEEIAGEALMKLWTRHDNFNNLQSIRSFLYTITRNTSLNYLRQQKKNTHRKKQLSYLSEGTEQNNFQKIIETETFREIFLAINTLPPKCRKIFKMIFIEGKEYEQIASELNLSTKTIYSQKDRALSLIRQRLSLGLWVGFFLHLLN
jgi:RNA polymerase sigma-70 factor (ECF subfamily)